MHSPHLCVQAFVKSVWDIQQSSPHPYVFQQFGIAYDVYVLSGVSHLVSCALGCADGNWCIKNCCAACNYHLEEEPKLCFSQLGTYDGNNSAKRIPHCACDIDDNGDASMSEHHDFCDGTAGYFLPQEHVDKWKHSAPQELLMQTSRPDNTVTEENPCATRWYNMVHNKESKMWGIFDETGIFVAICHHGFILIAVDMVKSGDLYVYFVQVINEVDHNINYIAKSKYPLAIVEYLIKNLGADLGMGYDIGCGFKDTIDEVAAEEVEKREENSVGDEASCSLPKVYLYTLWSTCVHNPLRGD